MQRDLRAIIIPNGDLKVGYSGGSSDSIPFGSGKKYKKCCKNLKF
jgi:uncharacterized protein YecA (UPF0149 family)